MLITNATVVTSEVNSDYAIYIENGTIGAVGPTEALIPHYRSEPRIDAGGQLVLPGNTCAHTHFYGAYARGLAIPGDPPPDFPAILRQLWWRLDRALDTETVYYSAMVCLIDAIRHGTTTLIDHHASPNAIEGSLDHIARAVDESGLRAILCYEVTDRDGMDKAQAGIDENVRFIGASRHDPRIRGTFGLHASLTLSDETLKRCVDALPDGAGFHIHVAEHEADQENSLERSGKRLIPRLLEAGILGEKTITAHCVHIDETERQQLKQSGTWITHQPRSNMNNGVGAMAFDAMMAEDMRVCLGNDGFSNNMWAEWKTAYLLHKVTRRDPRAANGGDIARMAVHNNARLLEQFFPEQSFGEIREGAAADLIFVDYKPFTPLTAGNLPWHILFGFESSMVTTTIVAGQVLMRDRQLLTLDEDAIMREAAALAPKVWERFNAL
jgi:putative selenium metabolism protein SsnA